MKIYNKWSQLELFGEMFDSHGEILKSLAIQILFFVVGGYGRLPFISYPREFDNPFGQQPDSAIYTKF